MALRTRSSHRGDPPPPVPPVPLPPGRLVLVPDRGEFLLRDSGGRELGRFDSSGWAGELPQPRSVVVMTRDRLVRALAAAGGQARRSA